VVELSFKMALQNTYSNVHQKQNIGTKLIIYNHLPHMEIQHYLNVHFFIIINKLKALQLYS